MLDFSARTRFGLRLGLLGLPVAAALVASLVSVLPATTAHAQGVTFSGTLAATDPVFNRPEDNGNNTPTNLATSYASSVNYNVQQLYVNVSGAYDILGTANYDNFIAIYSTNFNPSTPLVNAVAANDDFPNVGRSGFTGLNLTANMQYFFVTTAFSNDQVGNYTNSIGTTGAPSGSTVTLVAPSVGAPEPGTLPLVGMGLAGGLGMVGTVRRRKAKASA